MQSIGCSIGSLFAPLSDKEVYAALTNGDATPLLRCAESILAELFSHRPQTVASDALEGFNPSHDLCRCMVEAALQVYREAVGHDVRHLAFFLDDDPEKSPAQHRQDLSLSEEEFHVKLAACRSYEELQFEVDAQIKQLGVQGFKKEVLFEPPPLSLGAPFFSAPPRYETIG